MANPNDGTGAGLLAFLERAGKRGEITKRASTALRTAVGHVLSVEEDPETVDVRTMDLEDIVSRFENLKKSEFSPSSLAAYRSRFRQAVTMYRTFLDGGTWRPANKRKAKESSPNGQRPQGAKESVAPPGEVMGDVRPTGPPLVHGASAVTTTVTYSLPLRPDLIIRIDLPVDLTQADAARVAAFVKSLAFEEGD